MSDKVTMQLTITKDAADVLRRHASQRKRGEWLSNLLVSYEIPDVTVTDIETLRLQMIGLASTVKSHDARMVSIESALHLAV